MNGYSICLIPKSWALGLWRKHQKTIFSVGPLRFVIHRGLGPWKMRGGGLITGRHNDPWRR